MKEKFRFIEYSTLSREGYVKDPKEKNFGDVLFDFSQNYSQLTEVGSFITTHISRRSTYYGSSDRLRANFLDYMVALKVLIKVKEGSENGYKINREPTDSDFLNAFNYANCKNNNDRGFEAFANNESERRKVATKSAGMKAQLISTLFEYHGYKDGNEYDINQVKADLGKLYKTVTIDKLINCMAIEGAIEINYYVNQEDGEVEDTRIKFNRIKLYAADLDFYADCNCIPGDCNHVHRIPMDGRIQCELPMFESLNELMSFYNKNVAYLINSGKMPKEF